MTLATTIKKALASLSRRDNHRPAATANHPILIVALSIQIVALYPAKNCVEPVIECLPMPDADPRRVVLVVEDENLVRMFMTNFLDEAGFKVFEAAHADEALAVLQARPDVQAVVTDPAR